MADYNDIQYAASLIEYVGRKTNNKRDDIVKKIGFDGIAMLIEYADISHCLPFEQVSDQIIIKYNINSGTFDTISTCKFEVPSYLAIGSVYARLIKAIAKNTADYTNAFFSVMTSGISDLLSDFNSAFFFSSSEKITHFYRTRYHKQKTELN